MMLAWYMFDGEPGGNCCMGKTKDDFAQQGAWEKRWDMQVQQLGTLLAACEMLVTVLLEAKDEMVGAPYEVSRDTLTAIDSQFVHITKTLAEWHKVS